MEHDKKLIEKIAIEVQTEYQMGGLADGLYLEFVTDVAIRYANELLPQADVIKSVCQCIESEYSTEHNNCGKCNLPVKE